jgi:hypothetical protein
MVKISLFLLNIFVWTHVASASPGSDSISLPPLQTDEAKLTFLMEIKRKLPNLFSEASLFAVDLFSLIDDEMKLLGQLNRDPEFLKKFEKKKFFEIQLTPPPGGIRVNTVKIRPEAVKQWQSELTATLDKLKRDLGENSKNTPTQNLAQEISKLVEIKASTYRVHKRPFKKLLAEVGKPKENHTFFQEKIGKNKDLDLRGRLLESLNHYDDLPVKTVTRKQLHEAIISLNQDGLLRDFAILQLVSESL